MTVRAFVDTNVWVYAYDQSGDARQQRAAALLQELQRTRALTLSVQVISEFREVLRRRQCPIAQLNAASEALLDLEPQPLTAATLRSAMALTGRHSLSWWDALIVASALGAGCTHLYSEDLAGGSPIEGLEIVNPFAAA